MMAHEGFDAVILTNLTSIAYTAGTFHSVWNSSVAVIVPIEGEVTMIVPLGGSFRLKYETWISDLRSWTPTFHKIPELLYETLLVDVLKGKGLSEKTIGIEEDGILWSTYEKLKEGLTITTLVGVKKVVIKQQCCPN